MFTTIISPAEFKENLQDNWVILDCRFNLIQPEAGRDAYNMAHLQNAHYLDLNLDLSSAQTAQSGRHPLPDMASLALKLGNLGIGNNTQVIVYDQRNSFMAAARAWWTLKYLGHEKVAVLDGGFDAANACGLKIDDKLSSIKPQKFEPNIQNDFVVDADWVMAHLNDPAYQIIDARNEVGFAGHEVLMDPITGHIPSAINRNCELNVTAEGYFKSKSVLQQELADLSLDLTKVEFVHQCGSGVRACHNILAMQLAGLNMGKLYVGSWSEWIKNPQRPVEKS